MTTSTAVSLNPAALQQISASVPVPEYDRSRVEVGIVHFGVGGFHRAHQAMYTDAVLAAGATDWGICGVGVMPGDARMRDALDAQEGLYTLVTKAPDGTLAAQVIGSIVRYLYAPDDPEAVLSMLTAPSTRIVSLTVTEGGYSINQVTGEFDPTPPEIAADLRPDAVPGTTFGLIVEGLRRRRDQGVPPFTVLSCDNLQGNGDLAAKAFKSF